MSVGWGQPVAILRAVFCMICRYPVLDVDVMEDHVGLAYVRSVLMYCLYSVVIDSLVCPKVVPVSAFRALRRLHALLMRRFVCGVKVRWYRSLKVLTV